MHRFYLTVLYISAHSAQRGFENEENNKIPKKIGKLKNGKIYTTTIGNLGNLENLENLDNPENLDSLEIWKPLEHIRSQRVAT